MDSSDTRPLDEGAEPGQMCKVSFETPSWVIERRHMTSAEFADWVRVAAAIFRYTREEITFGTAAALAGMSQDRFMLALKELGQDTFTVDFEDLDRELAYLAERRRQDRTGD